MPDKEKKILPSKLKAILSASGEDGDGLVDWLKDNEKLDNVKSRVLSGYDMDLNSMKDYIGKESKYQKVLELAQMKDSKGDKTFPFVGASKVMMPYLAQAGIDFWSRTLPDVVNQRNIAKCAVYGKHDKDKEDRAERISLAINYQLRVGIQGWREGMSYALNYIAIVGMYFKKKWYEDGEIKDFLITADKLIYDHEADSFDKCPRKSHKFTISRNDYNSKVVSGEYEPIKFDDTSETEADEDIELVESHCTLDLDGDGYSEPYIVVFHVEREEIVNVAPRFTEEDVKIIDKKVYKIKGEEFFTQSGFFNDLEKPAVFIGWGWLLYDLFESLNTMNRQLLDAGTLANVAGSTGFISSNSRIGSKARGGKYEMIPGQLTKIDSGGTGKLSDSIFTMPFQGPNQGLYALLEKMKEEVRAYTTVSQSVDISAGEAASMYLARLQQALKVPNAIMTQTYYGLSAEFQRIYDLMDMYMSNEDYVNILDWQPEIPPEAQKAFEQATQMAMEQGQEPPLPPESIAWEQIAKENDFADGFDIQPTADPSMGSVEERAARAEAIAQRAQALPQYYNVHEAEKNWLKTIGATDIEAILPPPSNEPSKSDIVNDEFMKSEINKSNSIAILNDAKTQDIALDNARADVKQEDEIDKIQAETMEILSNVDRGQVSKNLDLIKGEREERLLTKEGSEDATRTLPIQAPINTGST